MRRLNETIEDVYEEIKSFIRVLEDKEKDKPGKLISTKQLASINLIGFLHVDEDSVSLTAADWKATTFSVELVDVKKVIWNSKDLSLKLFLYDNTEYTYLS